MTVCDFSCLSQFFYWKEKKKLVNCETTLRKIIFTVMHVKSNYCYVVNHKNLSLIL